MTRRQRVVVAMSGGVDSSVAAALLKEQGHEVIGITMRLWTQPRPEGFSGRTQCCGIEDVDDARRVAQALEIPHYTLNLERPFKRFVVDQFVQEYADGRTPNPCLNCNTYIKFDLFLERALALGADAMATGHYARRVDGPDGPELHRAADREKDQSYVLYTLSPQALERSWFPLGELSKPEVRAIAARHRLAVAEKPDSADICFVPGGDYRAFVRERLADRAGVIQDAGGAVLGEHGGVQHFTVGQRKRLGVAIPERRYVTAIDAQTNVVTLGREDDLLADRVEVAACHWLTPRPPGQPFEAAVKLRYRSALLPAWVIPDGDGVRLELHEPARAVAPGQAAVVYLGDRVLGGGTIRAAGRA